jgi:hypothetical protein
MHGGKVDEVDFVEFIFKKKNKFNITYYCSTENDIINNLDRNPVLTTMFGDDEEIPKIEI